MSNITPYKIIPKCLLLWYIHPDSVLGLAVKSVKVVFLNVLFTIIYSFTFIRVSPGYIYKLFALHYIGLHHNVMYGFIKLEALIN